MRKVLVAIDGSECAYNAVKYIGRQFSPMHDLDITLLHVLPYPPAPLWDDGHIPSNEEKESREKGITAWLSNQKSKVEPLFEKSIEILTKEGVERSRIKTKSISDSTDVAGSILEEARDGGYETLVLGRCGLSPAKKYLMGSITTKIVNHGTGIAICIVE